MPLKLSRRTSKGQYDGAEPFRNLPRTITPLPNVLTMAARGAILAKTPTVETAMAHDPKALQAILEKAAPPDLPLMFRPMFGGVMAYADGKVFASLSHVGLALKLGGEAHDALLALPGAKPLQYDASQPVSKTYVVVPEAMLTDAGGLRAWITRCVAALPDKAKKK